jgi:glycosyltransferase involved in cell wall biosynthesis
MTYRIGVDAHVLEGKHQGSKTTLFKLLSAFAQRENIPQFCLYGHSPDRLARAFNTTKFEYRAIGRNNPVVRLMVEFPFLFGRDDISIGLFQYICPLWSRRNIVVVHDILPMSHPEFFPFIFRLRTRLFYSASILSAAAVIAVSEYTASLIRARFPSRSDRVHVVHNGPSFSDEVYFQPSTSNAAVKYADGQAYVLCVGRIEPRKKVDLLVEAFRESGVDGVKLIIVGQADLGYRYRVPETPTIRVLKNLDDAELIDLYRGASLFVYPSVAEGFGIPLLDATLFGVPTISSNRTAMPEVGGDLVEYFDPVDGDAKSELARRIRDHFRGRPVARPDEQARRAQFRRFSWENAAEKVLEIINASVRPATER